MNNTIKRFLIALLLALLLVISLTYVFPQFSFFEMTVLVFSVISLAMLFERLMQRGD